MWRLKGLVEQTKVPLEIFQDAQMGKDGIFLAPDEPIDAGTYKKYIENALLHLGDPYKHNLSPEKCVHIAMLRIEMCRLGKKKAAKLDGLHLTEIPDKIFDFDHLQNLDLSDNQLKSLNPAISRLKNLRTLVMSRNEIQALPIVLKTLVNLEKLMLPRNKIRSIDEQDCLPENLKWLSLSYNQLEEIPTKALELSKLSTLWLCENQINELHPRFREYLKNRPPLKAIYLMGNPMKKVPIYSWKGNNLKAILTYLEAAEKGTITNYEAKIVLIGNGNEGKTTLRQRLCFPGEAIKETTTTEGIEIEVKPMVFYNKETLGELMARAKSVFGNLE